MFKEIFTEAKVKIENKAPHYVSKELQKAIEVYADAVQADDDKKGAGHTYTIKYNKAYAAILWRDGEWAHSFVVINNNSNRAVRHNIGDIMKAGTSKTSPSSILSQGNVLQGNYTARWMGY